MAEPSFSKRQESGKWPTALGSGRFCPTCAMSFNGPGMPLKSIRSPFFYTHRSTSSRSGNAIHNPHICAFVHFFPGYPRARFQLCVRASNVACQLPDLSDPSRLTGRLENSCACFAGRVETQNALSLVRQGRLGQGFTACVVCNAPAPPARDAMILISPLAAASFLEPLKMSSRHSHRVKSLLLGVRSRRAALLFGQPTRKCKSFAPWVPICFGEGNYVGFRPHLPG